MNAKDALALTLESSGDFKQACAEALSRTYHDIAQHARRGSLRSHITFGRHKDYEYEIFDYLWDVLKAQGYDLTMEYENGRYMVVKWGSALGQELANKS